MSLLRRFVRWLARDEIEQKVAEAYEIGSQLTQAIAMQQARMLAAQAYAQGEAVGAEKAFKAVERHLAERMGGGQDLISAEDLARAKKGILH